MRSALHTEKTDCSDFWTDTDAYVQEFEEEQVVAKRQDVGWTGDGAFRCWVLVRRDDFDGPMYAGCET